MNESSEFFEAMDPPPLNYDLLYTRVSERLDCMGLDGVEVTPQQNFIITNEVIADLVDERPDMTLQDKQHFRAVMNELNEEERMRHNG